jgi:hypothetical protein
MALTEAGKLNLLKIAGEIAHAAAGSGTPGCCSADNLADIIDTTYKKLVELAGEIK